MGEDRRLRKKLFGIYSADCLNLYSDVDKEGNYDYWLGYDAKEQGFVGQTVEEIRILNRLVRELTEKCNMLEAELGEMYE